LNAQTADSHGSVIRETHVNDKPSRAIVEQPSDMFAIDESILAGMIQIQKVTNNMMKILRHSKTKA
jgi:hypothetical protein